MRLNLHSSTILSSGLKVSEIPDFIPSQEYVDRIKYESKNHQRVTPEGERLGRYMAALAEKGLEFLREDGEVVDERCKTCAFREGTVPNGCAQTQLDVAKCVLEGNVAFACHCVPAGGERPLCAGWVAAMVAKRRLGLPDKECPYDFSPEDPKK